MNIGSFESETLSKIRTTLRSRLLRFKHDFGRDKAVAASCPVCGHVRSLQLSYPPFETPHLPIPAHDKYKCCTCGHVFTQWLPNEINALGDLYSEAYDEEGTPAPNPRKSAERRLLDMSMEEHQEGSFLDFSCGNNYSVVMEARSEGFDVYGCDIRESFPAELEGLFQYHPSMDVPRTFDGIVSVDALEHVQDMESAWRFLNRSLEDGGVMLHSFPTAFRFHRGHHFFQIPFHACLFSRESLSRWSKQMGFKYRGEHVLTGSDVGYYYEFEKVEPV